MGMRGCSKRLMGHKTHRPQTQAGCPCTDITAQRHFTAGLTMCDRAHHDRQLLLGQPWAPTWHRPAWPWGCLLRPSRVSPSLMLLFAPTCSQENPQLAPREATRGHSDLLLLPGVFQGSLVREILTKKRNIRNCTMMGVWEVCLCCVWGLFHSVLCSESSKSCWWLHI